MGFFALNYIFPIIDILMPDFFCLDQKMPIYIVHIFIFKDIQQVNGKASFVYRPSDPQSIILFSYHNIFQGPAFSMIQFKSLFTVTSLWGLFQQPVYSGWFLFWMNTQCPKCLFGA